jgi:hypothetical protein
VVAGFQLCLALGAPWGSLTWGGRFPGVLPPAMRGVAALSLFLMVGFSWIVFAEVRPAATQAPGRRPVAIWIVVTYSALGVVANAVTPSPWERRLWLPVVAMMLATSLHVALAGPRSRSGAS